MTRTRKINFEEGKYEEEEVKEGIDNENRTKVLR